MLTFDSIYPYHCIVGELQEPGHDLLWRRRVLLYMVVPKDWSIPSSFSDRIMPDGYLGIGKGTLIRLPAIFRIRRGKIVSDDKHKAERHARLLYFRIQEEFWKDLYSKGIRCALETIDDGCGYRATPPVFLPNMRVKLLVPKTGSHRPLTSKEREDTHLLKIWKEGSMYVFKTRYFPQKPDTTDGYDEFTLVDRIYNYDYYFSLDGKTLLLFKFEQVRKQILDLLNY